MKAKKSKKMILLAALVVALFGRSHSQDNPQQSATVKQAADHETSDGWIVLFDGETLSGWESVHYGGEGKPYVKNGVLVLPMAEEGLMTGVRWVGDALPVNDYIVTYEARRVKGDDIFAALSFPYEDTYASLIFGGWRGIVNGLSSIDGYDALENETTQFFSLRDNQWYPVELRVTKDRIEAFVGTYQIVDLETKGKSLHLRPGLLDTGFTLWTYLSTGEIRNVRLKKIQSNL